MTSRPPPPLTDLLAAYTAKVGPLSAVHRASLTGDFNPRALTLDELMRELQLPNEDALVWEQQTHRPARGGDDVTFEAALAPVGLTHRLEVIARGSMIEGFRVTDIPDRPNVTAFTFILTEGGITRTAIVFMHEP